MAVKRKNAGSFVKYGRQAKKCMIFRQIWPSSEKMQDLSSNMAVKRENAWFFVKYGRQAKKCRIFRRIWTDKPFNLKPKTDKIVNFRSSNWLVCQARERERERERETYRERENEKKRGQNAGTATPNRPDRKNRKDWQPQNRTDRTEDNPVTRKTQID